jgi:endonuclease/exonuclease/phosphatase family metal-dependent hydrolase
MRRLTAFLCVLCVLLVRNAVHAELPKEIRVVSYNIHHGRGLDGKVDLKRIAEVIAAESPDIVALNEVDQGTRRTEGIDMPAELAALTNMEAVFIKNIDFEGGGYGNAVLTRLPIRRKENHKLPSHYEGEQRGVLELELGAADEEEPLIFLCTHLDYRPEDHERMASVKTIEDIAARHKGWPIILAGDLNARPDSAVLGAFGKTWKRANAKPIPTFPAANPQNQIDYVLVRPPARWETVEARVLEDAIASDHRGIVVVLRLKDAGNEATK